MKSILFLLLFLPSLSFALGDLAHNYVAENAAAIAQTKDATLQNILTNERNEYLVGSDYPDTGYAPGFNFGEDSHWPFFINPFVDYIKKTCTNPSTPALQAHCDQLTAFLLGIATHVKSDIVSHWTYYNFVALHDFGSTDHDAWSKAHDAMDEASDFYVIVRKGIYDHPLVWWVPVSDLVNVYTTMKQANVIKETVTANDIIEANAIYYLAMGLTEDLIAYPAYVYDAQHYIPWGIAHLEDPDPKLGAFPEMINQSAAYVNEIWNAIQGKSTLRNSISNKMESPAASAKMVNFAKMAIDEKLVIVKPEIDQFGDVIFSANSIQFTSPAAKSTFNAQLNKVR